MGYSPDLLELTTHGFRIFAPVLPLLRAEYLRIRLLHGPVQRRPVGPDRLHPHAAAAGWTGAGDAGVLRRGWRLVVRGSGMELLGVVLSVVLLVLMRRRYHYA